MDTRAEATLDPVHSYFQLKGSGSQPQARLGRDKSHLLTVSISRAMSDSRAQPETLSFGVPTGSTACQAQHVCAPGVRGSRTQAACYWFLQGEGWRVGGGGTLAPGSWRVGVSRPLPASPSLAPHSLCKKTDKGLTFSKSQHHPHLLPPLLPRIRCTNTGLLPSCGNSKSSSLFYSCPRVCRQCRGKTNPTKSLRALAVWRPLLCSSLIPSRRQRPGEVTDPALMRAAAPPHQSPASEGAQRAPVTC